MRRRFAALALAALAAACSKTSEPAPREAGPTGENAPRFYYDLGPATVDVSRYPPSQQEAYKLSLAVCGTCHSTARALNAPYSEPDTWKRYLRRMHVKMEGRAVLPSARDMQRILDFLVYDSKVRKLDRPDEFRAEQEALKARFQEASNR